MAPLACDGASDPTPNVASGRRLDGGPFVLEGPRSRRPGSTASGSAAS